MYLKQFITTLLFTSSFTALYAQPGNDVQTQLNTIADKMFAEGDLNFVLVQAYKDGLIDEAREYKFVYDMQTVTFNGKTPPGALTQVYMTRMQDFNTVHHKGETRYRMVGEKGVKLKDILDPGSSFRKAHANAVARTAKIKDQEEADKLILAEMVTDKLIDTGAAYNYSYNYRGLYVNGQKLQGSTQEKYKALFEKIKGFVPKQESDGSYTSHHSR